jgi:hypothetical protein
MRRRTGNEQELAGSKQAWIKQNPFLGIAYGKAFTSPTNQPRPAITEAEPFGQLLRDAAAYSGRQGNLVRNRQRQHHHDLQRRPDDRSSTELLLLLLLRGENVSRFKHRVTDRCLDLFDGIDLQPPVAAVRPL